MSGRVSGKVAFITGTARGQGRSHAVRLAQEGADIIAVDVCETIPGMEPFYPGATAEDLAETVRQVEALDRRIVASTADVRDEVALQSAFDEGRRADPALLTYTASKHAIVGIMRTLSNELAAHSIRVNSIHPTGVSTPMILNDALFQMFLPDEDHPTREQVEPVFTSINALPVPWVEPVDISNALLFLASDEVRYITGLELKVDAGCTTR